MMKRYKRLLLAALMMPALMMALTAGPATNRWAETPTVAGDDDDTILEDTAGHPERAPRVMANIVLTSRTYGDSVVLRWAAEDWAVQQALYHVGVDILRIEYTENGAKFDTLATKFKPWTKDQFLDNYPSSDSIATMAIGLLYGDRELKQDQTQNAPGSMGSWLELVENQKQHLIFTMLVAEWRMDVADHVAMRWVDRDVVPGRQYDYAVIPSYFDEENMPIASAKVSVTNEPYIKPNFRVAIGDSITGPYQVFLWWEKGGCSSFEIERRKHGETEWKRLTNIPYLNMTTNEHDDPVDVSYADVVEEVGDYEYRVFGHDPFGELTKPSRTLAVHVPDLSAPKAPELVLVEIDRQDSTDLSKQVMATFHFEKDTMEEDFIGFMPMYYNERNTKKNWKNLSDKMLAPTDTVFTCDVTGLSSGMVMVAAYDTAQNVSYSMPRMIQIKDVKAPAMMRNFKAEPNIEDGTVTLTWEPDSLDDDIEYYDVLFANDTTHTFVIANTGMLKECRYVDTLAMDVNQKYIYYKVRAVDYSTNQGEETPALRVLRPTRLKPNVAHLLESTVDSLGIHMTWACSNEQIMDRHVLMRRLAGTAKWDTLGIYSADSLKQLDNRLQITDIPPYNKQADYQYAVESFSCFDISSGLSAIVHLRYAGSPFFNLDIKLQGRYDKEKHESVLTWNIENNARLLGDDWYICLFRKGPEDRKSEFLVSIPGTDTESRSELLAPGESEEYSIKVRTKDGRESNMSNIVVITNNDEPESSATASE